MRMGSEDISGWATMIDTVIGNIDRPFVHRAVVMESTQSTQDSALRFAAGRPGLVLVASEQTKGRGSRGREWDDGNRGTLPCSFVIDHGEKTIPLLSACVACVVHETLSSVLPASVDLRIKWPNDIVVVEDDAVHKVAGILIEIRDGLAVIGIGINCTREKRAWPGTLQHKAIALSQLGVQVSRLHLVCRLIEHLSQWSAACDQRVIKGYYLHYDAMVGRFHRFRYDGQCFEGIVEHIDPLESISLQTEQGAVLLPIAQTTHERT